MSGSEVARPVLAQVTGPAEKARVLSAWIHSRMPVPFAPMLRHAMFLQLIVGCRRFTRYAPLVDYRSQRVRPLRSGPPLQLGLLAV